MAAVSWSVLNHGIISQDGKHSHTCQDRASFFPVLWDRIPEGRSGARYEEIVIIPRILIPFLHFQLR